MSIFIVENGINTCYIDSLFMALFYTPSYIYESMLNSDPIDINFMYFQEMIKTNFIEPIRKNNSVLADAINELRNYVFINGWKGPDDIVEQQNVSEFYDFLTEHMHNQYIELKNKIIDEDIKKIPFIQLKIQNIKNIKEISVSELMKQWIIDNNINEYYTLNSVPSLLPLYIDRNDKNVPVNIMEQVKLLDDNTGIRWSIQSIICKDTNNHYYTIIKHSNKWLLFDDMMTPCLKPIVLSDMSDKIKKECVFILYRFDNCN